jgi:hypothetical protein
MRAIEGVILCVTRKIGPKDEHFRILIFALWVLQATSYVPWLQNAVLGRSFASQRCCLKSPIRGLKYPVRILDAEPLSNLEEAREHDVRSGC